MCLLCIALVAFSNNNIITEHCYVFVGTKLYCLLTETQACKQLASVVTW